MSHPYDEYPLVYRPSNGVHELYRARVGEAPDGTCAVDLVASCTTFESLLAANFLLSGQAYYPLWGLTARDSSAILPP